MATIKQNFFYNALLNVLNVLFPFITAPYVARVLAPEGVGLFNFALTYAGYFAMLAILGIPTYGTRETAKVKGDREAMNRLFSELFSIQIFTTLGVMVLYFASVAAIPKLSHDWKLFAIMGTLLYLAPFGTDWFYAGCERFKYIALRSALIKTLSVIALFIFVKHKEDLLIYAFICVSTNIVNNAWNFLKLIKEGIRPRIVFSGFKKHIKPVMLLFASAVAVSVYTLLDTVMLGFLAPYSQVAFYSNSANITRAIIAALTSFAAVAIPRISAYMSEGNEEKVTELAGKSFAMVSFLAIPAALGLACIAPTFAPLFYGDKFFGTIVPLQIMALIIVAIGFNNLTGVQVLIGLGKDKLYLRSVVAGAIANVTLNFILIPFLGARGAALSSVAAESLIFYLTLRYVKRETFVKLNPLGDIAKSLVVALLFIPLVLLMGKILSGWWLVVAFIATGFCLYVALEWVLRNSAVELFFSAVRSFYSKRKYNLR